MPTGRNWFNFIFVNIGFILSVIAVYYFASLKTIQDNWALYRCNPMYMPLSNDISGDFTYCVQSTQTNMMGYMLQPITYVISNIADMGGELTDSLNMVRAMFDNIRSFFTTIVQGIFGVFLNIVIEFQKVMIGIKDLISKIIGVVAVLMYQIDGTMKTMNSAWNGTGGQLVRKLGNCFDPDTLMCLRNGDRVTMKNIELGDILENGSVVHAVMKIDNRKDTEEIYILEKRGVDERDIYVSGSHMIKNKEGKFIPVKECKKARRVDKKIEWFTCLITSDHIIQIGNETFWDWDDFLLF